MCNFSTKCNSFLHRIYFLCSFLSKVPQLALYSSMAGMSSMFHFQLSWTTLHSSMASTSSFMVALYATIVFHLHDAFHCRCYFWCSAKWKWKCSASDFSVMLVKGKEGRQKSAHANANSVTLVYTYYSLLLSIFFFFCHF